MLSHTFTFTAHLASSLRWQFHEDSYIQHKNEQNWLLHKKQMYKLFSPESFIKKKKNSQSKFYHTSIVQFLLFLPQKSELTYSKQFRCQPQSSIISTTDWQWRSPNVHKLSTPFFFQAGSSALLHFPVFYLMTQSRSVLVLLVRFRRWNWELASVFHCPRIPASLDFKLSPFLAWG